jgi:hypothetical protein
LGSAIFAYYGPLTLKFIDRHHIRLLSLGYHMVFEVPACATGQLVDDDVAITKQGDVKVYVLNRLKR